MDERLLAGWECGDDRRLKLNAYLKPWWRLTWAQRQYDYATVDSLPGVVAVVGLQIERND